MTNVIKFYRFLTENDIEYHATRKEYEIKFWIALKFEILPKFRELMGASFFDDEGQDCIMKDGYLVIDCDTVFGWLDIELLDIFTRHEIDNMD